jgi:hypothetical protein
MPGPLPVPDAGPQGMPIFHGLAAGFALLMLARHAAGAMRRQPVALFTCLLALAVLAYAVRGLLGP